MKPAPFTYHRAASLEQAVTLLAQGGGDTAVLAGGQSLGPMMNLRAARPSGLVDVGRLEALRGIAVTAGHVRIGAFTTHAAIEDGAVSGPLGKVLARVAAGIAYRAVRNAGTIGGSLAHADPAADWPAALLALDARIHLRGPGGDRVVAIDAFLADAFETTKAADEVIVAVEIPTLGPAARFGYVKFCRKPGEFAEALGAVLYDPGRAHARVVVGATGSRARRLPAAEATLATGRSPAAADIAGLLAPVLGSPSALVLKRQTAAIHRALQEVLTDA